MNHRQIGGNETNITIIQINICLICTNRVNMDSYIRNTHPIRSIRSRDRFNLLDLICPIRLIRFANFPDLHMLNFMQLGTT